MQKVTLVANGVERDFSPAHAERLLKMKPNGGWKLKDETDKPAITGQVDGQDAQENEDCGCGKSGATITASQPEPAKRKRSTKKGPRKPSGK